MQQVLWWGNGAFAAAVASGLAKIAPWPMAVMVGLATSSFLHDQLSSFLRPLQLSSEPAAAAVLNRHVAGYWTGSRNTTGGDKHRNASHDLRPTPVCPKFPVSPWFNSSIGDSSIKS